MENSITATDELLTLKGKAKQEEIFKSTSIHCVFISQTSKYPEQNKYCSK